MLSLPIGACAKPTLAVRCANRKSSNGCSVGEKLLDGKAGGRMDKNPKRQWPGWQRNIWDPARAAQVGLQRSRHKAQRISQRSRAAVSPSDSQCG